MKNTMTVAELIQALSAFSPNAQVFVQHFDEHPMQFENKPRPYVITEDDTRAVDGCEKGETVCLLDVTY